MDSYYLSLLEGAGGVRRERLPGGLGQTQLTAGGSNESGRVVRNVCENCAGGGAIFLGKIQFSP
jgi:DnaJ-class molecular chaperone